MRTPLVEPSVLTTRKRQVGRCVAALVGVVLVAVAFGSAWTSTSVAADNMVEASDPFITDDPEILQH